MVNAYKKALQEYKLWGGTQFKEILKKAYSIAKHNKDNKIGNFQIIFIILLLIFRLILGLFNFDRWIHRWYGN